MRLISNDVVSTVSFQERLILQTFADPLNVVDFILSGARIAATSGKKITLKDGIQGKYDLE